MSKNKKTSARGLSEPTQQSRVEILKREFLKLGQQLSSASTPKQAARIILKAADELLGWDCAYLFFYSPEEGRAYPVLMIDLVDGKKVDFPIPYAPEPLTPFKLKAIEEGGQLIFRSETDRSSHGMVPFGDTNRLSASLMIVPIRKNKKVTGFLSINSYRHNAYTHDDLATLQSLADHCGAALERIAAQEALRESETKLRALAARLQSAREQEGTRIAREIHDQLGQAMTGLKLDLQWLEKKLAKANGNFSPSMLLEKIKTMVQLTDQTIQSVRRISTELRPGILDDLGLIPAIEWQTREFQVRTGVRCESSLPTSAVILDQPRATAVFRIFQEILTNIARHAQASRAWTKIHRNGNSIVLEVRDNGKGVSEEELAETKSLGILGMRERALVFGGKVKISGKKGEGTTVTVKIPLPENGLKQ